LLTTGYVYVLAQGRLSTGAEKEKRIVREAPSVARALSGLGGGSREERSGGGAPKRKTK
jgi:hypothetical protein